MRIDNNRANFDRIEQARTDAVQTAPARAGRAGQNGGADLVSLSAGGQLASSAATAAAGVPDLRRDKVERAKALFESGQLGIDPHKLADKLIDRAISNDD